MTEVSENTQPHFTSAVDLACENVGGKAVAANDDFFASKENLVKPTAPIFIPDKYTDNGKWMDGWESRRRRTPGHDWCIVRLGIPGKILGVNVDTAHFTGNYPEACSIEACSSDEDVPSGEWTLLLSQSRLRGGSSNYFEIDNTGRWTHLRLNIFPDGGVARLRVYGEALPDFDELAQQSDCDLISVKNGGTVIACNDMFFSPKENLILPDRAENMGQGWETQRKRGPGNDWIVVRSARPGKVGKIEVDTNHFKGNFPESCSIEGALILDRPLTEEDVKGGREIEWISLLPRTPLQGHHRHFFKEELDPNSIEKSFNAFRMNIFPDGGVSRLRIFGEFEK